MDRSPVDVKTLISRPGPAATIVLPTPSNTRDADDQLDVRWRNARTRLAEQGTPEAELDELDAVAGRVEPGQGAAVVIIKSGDDDPAWVEYLDDAVTHALAVRGELPRLGPVLESRQRSVAHVIVVADRVGADVIAVDAGSELESAEVEGSELHIHRGHPGGWSQRRFQQRAENAWEANAGDVAQVVVDMAERVEPRFIAIAGDVRAVTFLLEQLPDELADISQKLDGQSPDLIADQTVRAAADIVARDTVAILETYNEAAGQGHAATDAAETLAALSEGRVDTLLVHDDPDDDRTARFERPGLACSILDRDATDPLPADAATGRLVDVAIRSALLSDAAIRFVPAHAGSSDGLGATLRW